MMLKARLIAEGIRYATYFIIAFIALLILTMGSVNIDQMKKESEAGSGSAASAAASVYCRPSGKQITVDELNQKLKGKGVFEGKAAVFINASKKYNIDPILVVAIALHETGQGKSNVVKKYNNPGGLKTRKDTYMRFPSLEAGIDFMTRLLRNYAKEGRTTIPTIAPKWAPIGASNDPGGLNVHWVSGVTTFANKLGGLSYECTQPAPVKVGKPSKYGFIRPVAGEFRITSYFGPRWNRRHKGIDVGCTNGKTPIIAAKSGRVVFAGYGAPSNHYTGYGNVVVLDHGGRTYTLYAHMSSLTVKTGQTIGAGQQVGVCGSTGRSTGPHLHFEVKKGSQYGSQVDPLPFLP